LLIRNSQLRATSLSSPNRLPRTVEEIGRIIEGIERKDPVATGAACRAHVQAAAEVAIRILRERAAGAEGGDANAHSLAETGVR
jgi:DNA-binding GntR family transcriptional regulator